MISDRYSELFDIPCYMFGVDSLLRPASFMDIAQELAAKGSEQMHFADADLAPHGLVWILARMSVRFDKMPVRLDSVTSQTWHRGQDGLYYIRDYRLLSADGCTAVRSASSWIIMNTGTHTVVRPSYLEGIIPSEPQNTEAVCEPAPKLVMPRGIEPVLQVVHKVVSSDLDYNGHTNNAKYVVWALDALGIAATGGVVSGYDINFNRETCFGDGVELWKAEDPVSGDIYVEGRCNGMQSFITRVILHR